MVNHETKTFIVVCTLLGCSACADGDVEPDRGSGLYVTSVSASAADGTGLASSYDGPDNAGESSTDEADDGAASTSPTTHPDTTSLTLTTDAWVTTSGGATRASTADGTSTSEGSTDAAATNGPETTDEPGPACPPAALPPLGDCAALGITIDPAFAADYTCVDLGKLASVPEPWGGFAMKLDDSDTLLITGGARSPGGRLYAVAIGRDADCHIGGFTGTSQDIAEAPYNEAGVAYGPDGVLFLAQAIVNKIGQLEAGSSITDKVVDMGVLGVDATMCGVGFVPPGFAGAGRLKLIDWPSPGSWYDASIASDGAGTFDVLAVSPGAALPGGAAGFVFIPAGNPGFPVNTVLVSEYNAGTVAAYDLIGMSDPDPLTRRPFVQGIGGAQGGVVDPVSGDFLFSTYSPARIIAIRGFKPIPG